MKRFLLFTTILLLLIGGTYVFSERGFFNSGSLASNNKTPEEIKPDFSPEDLTSIVSAKKELSFKLLDQILAESENEENVFISPLSIDLALLMTLNATAGETREELGNLLSMNVDDLESLNLESELLSSYYQALDPEVDLAIANSLWFEEGNGAKLIASTTDEINEHYGAEVAKVDFSKNETVERVNDWIEGETNDLISDLINEFHADTIALLINTVYFKGSWTNEFDESNTRERDFTTASGETKRHPLMEQENDFMYMENEIFQAVKLPYGDEKFNMTVFLPHEEAPLEEFHDQLSIENWERWQESFGMKEGVIALPKFKADYEIKLKDTLKSLGVERAFNREGAGDFSGLFTYNPLEYYIYINEVTHKAVIDVNEEGTEAAAATAVEFLGTTSISPADEKFEMIVDRPFFFVIEEVETGGIMFMGSMIDPSM